MRIFLRIGCILLMSLIISSCGKQGRDDRTKSAEILRKSAELQARLAKHPECLDMDAVFEDRAQAEVCQKLRFDIAQNELENKALDAARTIQSQFAKDEGKKGFEVSVIDADMRGIDDPGFIHLAVIIPKAKAQLMLNNMQLARSFGEETAKTLADWMLQNGWKPNELGQYPENLGGDPRVKIRLAFIHTYDTPTFFGQVYFDARTKKYVWTNKPIGKHDPILKSQGYQ